MISAPDITSAYQQIAPFIHKTPILTSTFLNDLAGASLFFKCENFQKIGAFKIRGALNAAFKLTELELKAGLATHSSGNHAQAIAYAAKILGTKAFVVMPNNSPTVKVHAVKGYGAEVIFCEPTLAARESTLNSVVERTGATFIHPFDNEDVICGQATCAFELLQDQPDLEFIVAPVGGGGLLSGTGLAASFSKSKVKVYGAEPEGAADAILSFQSGKVEAAPYIDTIADGLKTSLSERTLRYIRQNVEDILLVSEAEIKDAMRLIYERLKIVIEPSCAVPFAAVLKNKEIFKDAKVGIILTGGNVDLSKLGSFFQ